MTTITDLQKAEADVDNVLANIVTKTSAAQQDGKMGDQSPQLDVMLVVEGLVAILKGVKILLWWKPSWKTSIDNGIAFLDTFLLPDVLPTIPAPASIPAPVPAQEAAKTSTTAFYNPSAHPTEN